MNKSTFEPLNQKQEELLKGKIWWVADCSKPYLVKFGVLDDHMLLQVTNMQMMWFCKLTPQKLLQQKELFAKSLEISKVQDLISLFERILESSDHQARYTFNEHPRGELQFVFERTIAIFDFKWKFILKKKECSLTEILCQEVINPLVYALQCQEKRIEFKNKRFVEVEKDYVRKMTEMEKNLYKSPLKDESKDWENFISKPQNDKTLNLIQMDDSSKQFFRLFLTKEKKQEEQHIFEAIQEPNRIKRYARQLEDVNKVELEEVQLKKLTKKDDKKRKTLDFL